MNKLAAVLLLLAACAPKSARTVYRCPDGATFSVTRSADGKTATLDSDGQTLKLAQTSSSTGGALYTANAVYLGIDEESAYIAEGEIVVHQDCKPAD